MIFAWINFVIIMSISAFHVFWALGGKWGAKSAVPEISGNKVFTPGPVSTLIVALIMAFFAYVHLYKIGWQPLTLPLFVANYGLWLIGAIFLLRAIGEFRYVGFFKKVKNSRFAEMDSKYFSPLCILLGVNALFVASNY